MNKNDKIMIAGSRGMVGAAALRVLRQQDYTNLLPVSRQEVDLTRQDDVHTFLKREKPDYIIAAAARVGGILANNTYPTEFLYENLIMQTNLIHAAITADVPHFLFLGSSCIYPKFAPQPIREEALLTGPLEPTNEAYAIAKIAGIKLCDAIHRQYGRHYISAMPCNLYGIGDNFHPRHSHVIPGLLRRFHEAKSDRMPTVTCWGSGAPLREFLFVDDLAEALIFILDRFAGPGFLNVGSGIEVSVKELTETIRETVGYEGEIIWDRSKPDGTPRKLMDVSRLSALGWQYKTSLRKGLVKTYEWFLENQEVIRS
jgi:GDP-L-fucose synthase